MEILWFSWFLYWKINETYFKWRFYIDLSSQTYEDGAEASIGFYIGYQK